MKNHRILTVALAVSLATGGAQTLLAQYGTGTLAGTAKDEAKTPYEEYTVQARDMQSGVVPSTGTVKLNSQGNFSLADLPLANYQLELVNKDGKVVCTEKPYSVTAQLLKNDIVINCSKLPIALILLVGGGAAGLTAGVLAGGGPTSPSQ